MSVTPKPYIFPSDSVTLKGLYVHNLSSNGTVSVWPAKTKPPGPEPRVAIKFTLFIFELQGTISQENPKDSNEFARNSMTSLLLVSNSGMAELTLGRLTIVSS